MLTSSLSPSTPEIAVRLSLEEYRDRELHSEQRHEYDNGVCSPMTGGSSNHNRIVLNLVRLFDLPAPYVVYALDMRLWLPSYGHATYPDLMVIADDPVFSAGRTDEVLNPTLILETLSPSTAEYDRGQKFAKYRSIPDLREYVLVAQEEPVIERFWLGSDSDWRWQRVEGLDQKLTVETGQLSLPLGQIYRAIAF